jgi:hypothetical protein
MKPRLSILDPRFKYVSAAATDVRKTFERVRADPDFQREVIRADARAKARAAAAGNVTHLAIASPSAAGGTRGG